MNKTTKYQKNKIRTGRGGTCLYPALRRLRQEDCKFKASLDYMVKLCLK
jgi:hypothetical protein